MVGSSGDVNQGTTAGDDDRACRGQSIRGSEEASNDRGAKGCRKAVSGGERRPSHEGRRSAARLSASVRWRTAWPRSFCWQWAARNWVSGSARTTRLACSLRTSRNTSLSQPIGSCRLESRMRVIRLSGLGGRGSAYRSSYPHSFSTVVCRHVKMMFGQTPRHVTPDNIQADKTDIALDCFRICHIAGQKPRESRPFFAITPHKRISRDIALQ